MLRLWGSRRAWADNLDSRSKDNLQYTAAVEKSSEEITSRFSGTEHEERLIVLTVREVLIKNKFGSITWDMWINQIQWCHFLHGIQAAQREVPRTLNWLHLQRAEFPKYEEAWASLWGMY